ncbi:MAG TPA: sigma 54-interacting transcriptional regulator [Syntrophomonas sp.]|nr:sigma 54-interacting transcriptional regulator [Syntrophomonas sp.]
MTINILKEPDVTEREKFYRKVLEAYFGNILVVGKDRIPIYINEYTFSNSGFTKEAYNMSLDNAVENELLVNSSSLKALQTKEISITYMTGKLIGPQYSVGIPIFDENGELEMAVSYSQYEYFFAGLTKLFQENNPKNSSPANLQAYGKGMQDDKIIAESDQTKKMLSFLQKIASFDSTVLLVGESGTGKEVFAKYIYKNSNRSENAFIPVNCAAIPENLMESQFFGYSEGAFTGAKKSGKPGFFEMADNGTLFLDEIGDMPLSLQAKLLRVLETGEILRLGADKTIKVDVKIIAATNKDLERMVEDNLFREDLYYRLNVISVTIPPIRKRKDDIEPLINYFLNEYNQRYNLSKYFSKSAIEYFKSYDWPGNVREIKNTIERMVISSHDDMLTLENFTKAAERIDDKLRAFSKKNSTDDEITFSDFNMPLKDALHEFERQYILKIYNESHQNVALAAKRMGIHKTGLYKKLKHYTDPPVDKDFAE